MYKLLKDNHLIFIITMLFIIKAKKADAILHRLSVYLIDLSIIFPVEAGSFS